MKRNIKNKEVDEITLIQTYHASTYGWPIFKLDSIYVRILIFKMVSNKEYLNADIRVQPLDLMRCGVSSMVM